MHQICNLLVKDFAMGGGSVVMWLDNWCSYYKELTRNNCWTKSFNLGGNLLTATNWPKLLW